MLPHINAKDRHFAPPHYRVLIFRRYDSQPLLLSRLNLDQPSPATALDSQQRGLECVEEGLFIAPRGLDLLDELWCGGRLGLGGGRFCQNSEWLMWPPALNLMAACSPTCEVMSEVCTASACVFNAALRFVIY
jgi:hypothetical protein